MNMMNNIGPSIDPWGIPENTLVQSDVFPFITTLYCLPFRKFFEPIKQNSFDTVTFQLFNESFMWHTVKCFSKI